MRRNVWYLHAAVAVAGLLLCLQPAEAAEVRVAVAANFTTAMKRIAARFEASTGERVVSSFGSTGTLYAQICNGAPFDVFLAADKRRPRLLEENGDAVAGTRFTYAVGRLVLWSARPGYVDDAGQVLKAGSFAHLAMANPKTAPYGAAAEQVLKDMGLWQRLQPRLVQGSNVAQTEQFVATGNAELGFVALAQVKGAADGASGSEWLVPHTLYRPIEQQAVLLKRGRHNAGARAFIAYLKGAQARSVIEKLGYAVQ